MGLGESYLQGRTQHGNPEYTVRKVYVALKDTEDYISRRYNYIEPLLPDDIFFITSQELEDLYPDLSTKERETKIAKEKGAVFISKIGGLLASGEKHDGRAPDYDDWELNGDIIVYYPVLDMDWNFPLWESV